jgi:gamma-glutamylaminecyclotransferase
VTHRVFIYGTLKRGQYFHERYLGGGKSEFIGRALASTDYSLYIDGLPHMIAEPTDKPVKGELFLVNDEVLHSLDELEAHPVVYKRELIEVYDEFGERLLAWTYLRSPNFKGKSGAWKEDEFI